MGNDYNMGYNNKYKIIFNMRGANMSSDNFDNDNEVLLLSNLSSIEAEVIISKLHSYGIPVLKKSKGTGEIMEIYTGANFYGIDLFVSSDSLELARELLKPISEEDNLE